MSEDDLLHLLAAYRDLRESGEDDAAEALLDGLTSERRDVGPDGARPDGEG